MFNVRGTVITMSRGDTGAVEIAANGYTFGADDRVLFSIKSSAGTIVLQRVYEMQNNTFTVTFFNADTDTLLPGRYAWDVRYVVHPYYDANNNIIDGDMVMTPHVPMELQLLATVGDV